jgi:hypothetical protein
MRNSVRAGSCGRFAVGRCPIIVQPRTAHPEPAITENPDVPSVHPIKLSMTVLAPCPVTGRSPARQRTVLLSPRRDGRRTGKVVMA